MSGKYDDILHLPHHVSPTRKRMTMAERAAQFSPFAALTGYEDAIQETGRITEHRIELGEDEKAVLDWKQQIILAVLEQGVQPEVTVTYFQPDKRKSGGEFIVRTGSAKNVSDSARKMIFADGTEIPLFDITAIKILP